MHAAKAISALGRGHIFNAGAVAVVVPEVEKYEKFLDDCRSITDKRVKILITAAQLRRIVIMRKQGSTFKECGQSIGKSVEFATTWYKKLPQELK